MIKYEAKQNKYYYNMEDLNKILEIIDNGKFYTQDCCSREKVTTLVDAVTTFMANMNVKEENVILERHETEEEAREYFGKEFIDKFDKLLTTLDKQETIVALHGTSVGVCPSICEKGLQYKLPSISSTTVQQDMAYGRENIHYVNYESLLNWGHKNYKGLVIVAIPYECFYKEGLWNHFANTNTSAYGGQDYRIDSDFIVGYLDIEGKNIVLNPKYSREHNYEGYEKDNDIFYENLEMNNEKMKEEQIKSLEKLAQDIDQDRQIIYNNEEKIEDIDASIVPYIIEELIGIFNSIKNGFPNVMSEERYKYLLQELSDGFTKIQKILPTLKTEEQLKQEQQDIFPIFSDSSSSIDTSNTDDIDDIDFGDDIVWNDSVEQDSQNIHR